MENKGKIKNVIIGILVGIILILAIALIVVLLLKKDGTSKTIIKYRSYEDSLIEIEENDNFDIQANLLNDNRNLVVFTTSKLDSDVISTITVKFLDDNDNEVSNVTQQSATYAKYNTIGLFTVPRLKNTYAGKIKINISTEEFNDDKKVDYSKIVAKLDDSTNQDLTTDVKVNLSNDTGYNISNISGKIVAFKDDKIVGITDFYKENFYVSQAIDFNATLAADYSDDEPKALTYDNIKLYVTYATR